jgi:hypothetical protein
MATSDSWNPFEFLGSFIDWLVSNLATIRDNFINAQVELLNDIIDRFCAGIVYCLSFLPDFTMPTLGQISTDNQVMSFINWFIPFDILAAIVVIWIASEIAYIVIAPVLRWFKLIAR